MENDGYRWTISPEASGEWRWSIISRDRGDILLSGIAQSKAVAAAYVVRAIARGMTEPMAETLAA